MTLQIEYRREMSRTGITVAEFEAQRGLPLFSVFPEAEKAKGANDLGRFMYVTATEEERAALRNRPPGGLQKRPQFVCKVCGGTATYGQAHRRCKACHNRKRNLRYASRQTSRHAPVQAA